MNSSINNKTIVPNNLSSSIKSRRGRKCITDPVLANESKHRRRTRANDRERTRMRLLNESLEHLRTLLPIDPSLSCYFTTDTSNYGNTIEDRLTKIEILRTAAEYIRLLTDLLEANNNVSPSNLHSYTVSDHHFGYTTPYSYYHYC